MHTKNPEKIRAASHHQTVGYFSICFSLRPIGIAVVVGIEFGQVFVHSRVADSTDVITGSIGVWLGAVLATRLSHRLPRSQSAAP